MGNEYAQRRRPGKGAAKQAKAAQQPSSEALRAGTAKPTAEQLGHRVDLPDAMRAKMENAFGADLSSVKLYESEAVGDAGAKAITRGSTIAFAPGMLDFTSFGGQALLGHELSHVVSQQRGEVRGGGFLNDHALEARADREGAMAAAGEQIAMPTAAMSSVSAAPAAGPMQAKKDKKAAANQSAGPAGGEEAEEDIYGLRELFAEPGSKKAQEPDPFESGEEDVYGLRELFAEPAPAKKKKAPTPIKENESLDKMLEAGGSATESINDQFEKLEEARKKGGTTTFGKALKKLGMSEGGTGEQVTSALSDYGNSAMGGLKGALDLGKGYQDLEEAKESGSKSAAANARFDIAKAGTDVLGNTAKYGKTFAGAFSGVAANTAGTVLGGIGTAADLAGNTIGTLKGAYNLGESSLRKHRMGKSVKKLEQKKDKTAEDEKMLKIMRQGKGAAKIDQIKSSFDTASNMVGLGSNIATTVGSATGTPVGAAVGAVLKGGQKAIDAVGSMVTSYENDKFHDETVDGELDTKGAAQAAKDDDRYAAFTKNMSEDDLRRAQLRALGYKSGKTDEAFQDITDKRATDVVEMAKGGNETAQEYARNAGVNYKKKNAQKAIRKSLGVEKMQEFNDSDQLKYNAFEAGAKSKAEADKRTNWEGVKYYAGQAKDFARDTAVTAGKKLVSGAKGLAGSVKRGAVGAWGGITKGAKAAWGGMKKAGTFAKDFATSADKRKETWDSVKTGAGKAVSAVGSGIKKGAEATWGGMKKAGGAVKDFATSADTRKAAWDSVKTGAVKAAKSVGSGVVNAGKYAGNVVAHSFNSAKDNITEWYQNGVDQMNLHGDTYKQMGALSRAAWTMKNLPARMTHGLNRNKQATYERTVHRMNADEIMEDMKKRKEGSGA